ncbi:MAG: hypothetical protein OSA99_21380, partial [Acidimicrobiales bacterium]|nr:hypothetical protein [Acidimicrobiales bacterium]
RRVGSGRSSSLPSRVALADISSPRERGKDSGWLGAVSALASVAEQRPRGDTAGTAGQSRRVVDDPSHSV